MNQADQLQQQPWTLTLRARAKRFDFEFKYSKICKPFHFSIRFKLRPFFNFEFESKPQRAFSLKRKLSDLKFLQKLKYFRRKRSGNKSVVATPAAWIGRKGYFFGRRKKNWIWVLLFAVVCIFVIMLLRFYLNKIYLWNFIWMAWNHAAASYGFFHHFFKVIFDGLSPSLGFL